MKHVIGIDVGTNSVKVILIANGQILEQASSAFSPDLPEDGWVEQGPDVWWKAVKEAVLALLAAYPGADVAALACAGQMHSSVFLDKDGNSIRKAILWSDTRTTKQVENIKRIVGEDNLLKYVQNQALEGFTAPKILWLRDN